MSPYSGLSGLIFVLPDAINRGSVRVERTDENEPSPGTPVVNRDTIQEMVLLGLLAKGPLHGYEIRKAIYEKLARLVGVRVCSIYYSLDKLEKTGILRSESARSGKRPKKYVYSLTNKGRRRLQKLLVENILTIDRPFLNIDLSLFFMEHADPESFKDALKQRLKALRALKKGKAPLSFAESDFDDERNARLIAEHGLRHLKQEIKFTKELIEKLDET